jgi:peptide/nickel transport system substrate-binding protein
MNFSAVPSTTVWRTTLLLAAALALGACGGGDNNAQNDPADNAKADQDLKNLTIGFTQYPSTMHPNIETMVAKSYVRGMLARAITIFNHDWELECSLCVELPTIENGLAVLEDTPDGSPGIAVTYALPPQATWGDGTPVTTKDILLAYDVGRNTSTGANNTDMYRRIYKLDVHDEKRFTIHLDRVTFDYNVLGDFYPLPDHIEREVFEADPYEYRHRTQYNANVTNPGLWHGPYLISEAQQGSYLVMTRNPHWHGKTPYFERITTRAIQNTSAMEANILSGTIDMIAGELGLQLDQALAFESRHGEKFNIIYNPGLQYEHIDVNLENPILADKRVRQALLYGMDREQMNQRIFSGKQPVADTSVSPMDKVASDNITKYGYDKDKAAALLEAAGWTDIRDGVRHNAEGEPLKIEIMSTAGNKTRELLEQIIQGQLKEIGVDLRIRNEAPRVFFGQTTRERRFTGLALFAWVSAPENVPRSTLHSTEIPTAENNYAGQNYSTISLPELDAAIEAVEQTLTLEGRRPYWEKIQQIYSEELPVLPLFWRPNSYILPHWLKGARPTGHLDSSTNWVEEWRRE